MIETKCVNFSQYYGVDVIDKEIIHDFDIYISVSLN